MIRRIRSQRGLTFVELMIGITLCVAVMMVLARLLPGITDFFRRPPDRASAHTQAQTSMETMLRFLNGANWNSINITTPAAPGQPLWSSISFQKLPPTGYAIPTNYQFVQSGDQLLMYTGAQSTVLAKNISQVSFVLPKGTADPNILTVSLVVQIPGELSDHKTIFLRRSIHVL
jgi:Tfp pilus assembly protein PilE